MPDCTRDSLPSLAVPTTGQLAHLTAAYTARASSRCLVQAGILLSTEQDPAQLTAVCSARAYASGVLTTLVNGSQQNREAIVSAGGRHLLNA